jgi:hypothetical protein
VPIEHRYDAENRTLFIEVSGEITEAELMDGARKLASDPSVPAGHRELVDLSRAQTGVSPATLRHVAAVFAAADRKPEESQVAIYAPGDLFFGLARMYEAFRASSSVRIRIFRTLDEARAWLGID